ncbi:TIGR03619 family F420-dependent LLM class oxidoreductase [Aquihabitans sp. McL0605]|uniref:TIGR03619 family F420-dependent LLM class oxidoreductase n=1 Tax=Aquihabitans sp. McL0605 TaxID=3415671 RepID=UPI003CF904F5
MQFTLALAMTPPERILPLARAAEDAGWDSVCFPDSVFYPEQVSGEYPFTPDGKRFWADDSPFVDPLVGMPAVAAATQRVNLYTNVLKTPLREPLLVAKSLGSIAAMFPGRIGLGVGLSWIPEEFRWLGQEMKTRGKRLDEQIEIMRLVIAGGYVEYHGQHYDFDRLRMEPPASPDHPVPIYVGGHSEPGLRRAARVGDGWIGAQVTPDSLEPLIAGLRTELDAAGRAGDPFEIKATPIVPATVDDMAPLAAMGLTDVITVPWYFAGGDPNDFQHQLDSVAWFAEHVIHPLRDLEITP